MEGSYLSQRPLCRRQQTPADVRWTAARASAPLRAVRGETEAVVSAGGSCTRNAAVVSSRTRAQRTRLGMLGAVWAGSRQHAASAGAGLAAGRRRGPYWRDAWP